MATIKHKVLGHTETYKGDWSKASQRTKDLYILVEDKKAVAPKKPKEAPKDEPNK